MADEAPRRRDYTQQELVAVREWFKYINDTLDRVESALGESIPTSVWNAVSHALTAHPPAPILTNEYQNAVLSEGIRYKWKLQNAQQQIPDGGELPK